MLKELKFPSELFLSVVCAVAFVFISIPAFSMTGLIVKPLILSVCGTLIICLLIFIFNKSALIIASGQLMFILFWLVYVIIKQIELQIEAGWNGKWIYFFYFDKLLIVGTIWLISTVFVLTIRLIKDNLLIKTKKFFQLSSIAFIIFYLFLLIYSFVLIRLEKGNYPINLTPFSTINEYIENYSSIPYEVFMMFFGNLLYFTPLGYIFYVLLRGENNFIRIPVIILFPVLAFSALEYSQYLFQNGFCEFDDMMMNSVGFWIGAVLGFFSDFLIKNISKGKLTYLWE